MTDRVLFLYIAALMSISIIFSFSLSAYIANMNNVSMFHFFTIQVISCFIALWIMWFISRLDPDVWMARIGFSLFFIFFLLMAVMPFLPSSLVPLINGAKRWIRLGGLSISPVEFFKIGFVWFLAWSFTRRFAMPEHGNKRDWKEELQIFAPYGGVLAIILALLVFMQNDLGQAFVLMSVLLIMLFFMGTSSKLFFILFGGAFVAVVSFIVYSSYRLQKVKQWWGGVQDTILSFLPPSLADSLRIETASMADQGYQVAQSLQAIHNGGLWGTGLGNGVFKLGFVSDVHTDFVLSGIIEESGFFGASLIVMLLLGLIFRILKIANRSDNLVYHLFCVGIGMIFSMQFTMNALGIAGVFPVKGITLPFVSYGGSSVIALSIAVGMVLSISKKAKL